MIIAVSHRFAVFAAIRLPSPRVDGLAAAHRPVLK
jgi:hypothetical protein